MSEPKIEQVKRILDSTEGRALEAYLKSRQRSRGDMDLRRVVRALKERGYNANLQDVIRDFKGFEALGLGRLIYDKKRFSWDYNFVSLAKALEAKGQLKARIVPQSKFNPPEEATHHDGDGGQHIIIRKDGYEIVVPLDIDDAGLIRLNHILERLHL